MGSDHIRYVGIFCTVVLLVWLAHNALKGLLATSRLVLLAWLMGGIYIILPTLGEVRAHWIMRRRARSPLPGVLLAVPRDVGEVVLVKSGHLGWYRSPVWRGTTPSCGGEKQEGV